MGFKKYIVASFLLIAIIAGYVYSLDMGNYNLVILELGLNATLPIFVWITIPAIALFVATILHMTYYGTKSYFIRKVMLKDMEKISIVLKDRLLNNKSNVIIKTKELKEVASVLNQLEVSSNKEKIETSSSIISKISENITKINNGEYVNIKDLKLESSNPIVQKNILNRVNNDDNFAIEVLKSPTTYESKTVEVAFANIIHNKSFDTIKKLAKNMTLSKDMVKLLLAKDAKASKEFSLTNGEILVYIQDCKLTNEDLITIARDYKRNMSPEQLIKLYEDISANDEALTAAYLYVLFEYEMIEQIREILVNSQSDEFIIFKALLDLKDAGKHYNYDSFSL